MKQKRLSILVIIVAMCALVASASTQVPPTPFMITRLVDANGREHNDRIPAIRLE